MSNTLKNGDRERVAEFVEVNAGIQLPAAKHSLVESRLRKRQKSLGMTSLTNYIDFVLDSEEGVAEQINLLDALTTNKTDFYREPYHFEFLRDYLHSNIKKMKWDQAHPMQIWSAGSSTGEEAYTIAIELLEFKRNHPNFDFVIHATDISITCLQIGRQAVYRHQKIEPIPLNLRKRYLLKSKQNENQKVKFIDQVREKVNFTHFNLLTDSYQEYQQQFDIIFCRNVMIYFNERDRKKIISNFSTCLKGSSMLLIGHSETITNYNENYQRICPTVYQLSTSRGTN